MGKRAQSIIVIGKPKIKEKRLKYKRYYGEASPSEYSVEINLNKNKKQRAYLDTLIHELAHIILPDASETKIRQITRILMKEIWKRGYRKIK